MIFYILAQGNSQTSLSKPPSTFAIFVSVDISKKNLALDPAVIAKGFANNGQAVPTAGR